MESITYHGRSTAITGTEWRAPVNIMMMIIRHTLADLRLYPARVLMHVHTRHPDQYQDIKGQYAGEEFHK
jgi:hypothetical protein